MCLRATQINDPQEEETNLTDKKQFQGYLIMGLCSFVCRCGEYLCYIYSCNLTILIIPEYYVPLYSAFEQVLLPGDTALYKCFLLLLLLLFYIMCVYRAYT